VNKDLLSLICQATTLSEKQTAVSS